MSQITEALALAEKYKRALMVLLMLNLLDAGATLHWIHCGIATEANPIMNQALLNGAQTFLIAKILAVILAAIILWNYRTHMLSRIGIEFTSVVYAALAGIHIGAAIQKMIG